MPPVTPSPSPRSGFIEPCLPSPAERPPPGPDWIHEIKHDGYRLMAHRDSVGIRLLTRNGHDWSPRYPLIREAVNRLKVRSCLIDGDSPRTSRSNFSTCGRTTGGWGRKATLASVLRGCLPGLRLNEHMRQ